MIESFFASRRGGAAIGEAQKAARIEWLRLTGQNISYKAVERIVARIAALGGPSRARLADYIDGRANAERKERSAP